MTIKTYIAPDDWTSKRIADLQAMRHALLLEYPHAQDQKAEMDIRLSIVRAELNALYQAGRKNKEQQLVHQTTV